MKRILLVLLAVTALALPGYSLTAATNADAASASNAPKTQLSSRTSAPRTASAVDIVKLKKAGLDNSVLKAFIDASRTPYIATVEDILYLHENQIAQDLIAAWMQKGSELVERSAQASIAARNPMIQQQNQAVQQQQPSQVIYQTAPAETQPVVVYTSPSYGYSAYYSPYSYWPSYYYPTWGFHGFHHSRHFFHPRHLHVAKFAGHQHRFHSGHHFRNFSHFRGNFHVGFRGHGKHFISPGISHRFAGQPRFHGGNFHRVNFHGGHSVRFRPSVNTAGFRGAPGGGRFVGGGGMRFASGRGGRR